ncbi:Alpha/Beta hydrolase protein [Cyathus striatus]|nr:Alpha/Beta hydrolase protein [Cyathus striatus]
MPEPHTSRILPGRYPVPGVSSIADAIRARRGERDLTALDGALLHVPPAAEGWNILLGAVRNRGRLPGDIRELMILRVAAINNAAYEWIHHESVGRSYGLTSAQLYMIRDIETPLPPSEGILTALQMSALLFADTSTRKVTVPIEVILTFKQGLRTWAIEKGEAGEDKDVHNMVDDLYAEAALVTSTYNMVSRFLVAADIAGMMDDSVPWPIERKEYHVSMGGHTAHAITLVSSISARWVVFANSLLTDLRMWNYVVPYFLSGYNILLHSQRGHGQTTIPRAGEGQAMSTIVSLAKDVHVLLSELSIPMPVHGVIGVSQGGAVALAFAALYGNKGTKSIVVCDTGPKTAEGNKEAWEERIGLVYEAGEQHAMSVGMKTLAGITIPRWFPGESEGGQGSRAFWTPSESGSRGQRGQWVGSMIEGTDVRGFAAGARGLGNYDVVEGIKGGPGILESDVGDILLVSGALDGGGKVSRGLTALAKRWNEVRGERGLKKVEMREMVGAGHLPMIDESENWWAIVGPFLRNM